MNPYIPFQLCEIAVLKSVKNWSNTRVRIFGKVGKRICVTLKTDLELRYFHSIGEETISNIAVNFGLISDRFGKDSGVPGGVALAILHHCMQNAHISIQKLCNDGLAPW